jgi:hypothetical protein
MIEPLFDKDKARRRTRHAATRKLSNASIRRCTVRSPDRLSRRAGMAAISRGAITSATLPSRKGLIVGIGRQCGSAEWIPHRSRGAAGGSPSGPRGVGACRHTCVPHARAPSGVVVAATRQGPGAVPRRNVPCIGRRQQACGDNRNGGSAGPGTAQGAGGGYPDNRAEIGRAAWVCNLTTSRWPGVAEPAGISWSCPPPVGRRRCAPGRGVAGRVAGDRVVGAIMAGRPRGRPIRG